VTFVIAAKLYSVIVLFHARKLLLLRRADWKAFAPGRWTGIGGRVEPFELGDLVSSARRELFEETDLGAAEVSTLVLRRTLTFYRADEGLVTLVYFTSDTVSDRVPTCTEGTLAWKEPSELDRLDVIENTAKVLPFLVHDLEDPASRIRCGVATLRDDGGIDDVVFV
jgi:8-oxo-dGTP diphosphatase